jgi:hypothetical protein
MALMVCQLDGMGLLLSSSMGHFQFSNPLPISSESGLKLLESDDFDCLTMDETMN